MNKMRIDKYDWLVVCDGRKALILENLGDEMFPNLHTREVREQANPPTAAQATYVPGRLHAAVGGKDLVKAPVHEIEKQVLPSGAVG